MLNQAVNDLKGIKNEYGFETNVDLNVDAFIPSSYIKSEYQKLMNFINREDPKAFVTIYNVSSMQYQPKI